MKPTIVYQSDCGLESTRFAIVAGIIETICPNTEVMDCNLSFEKNNITMAGAYLYTNAPYWPSGTIFISEVGEGEPVAIELNNESILLSPNNGTVTMLQDYIGMKKAYRLREEENVYAKVAAKLASGEALSSLGEEMDLSNVVLYEFPKAIITKGRAEGAVAMLFKTFGNLTFTIGTDEFEETGIRTGDLVRVTFTKDGNIEWQDTCPYQPSFGYVEEGAPVVFNGSSGYMDIGLNQKNFIKRCLPQILEVKDPTQFKVVIEKVEVAE